MALNAFPSKEVLHRNINIDPNCPRCHGASESIPHRLLYCPIIKPVWSSLLPNQISQSSLNLTFKDWLLLNLQANVAVTPTPLLTNLICNCRSLLGRFREIRLRQIYREANSVADALAKHGRSIPDFATFSYSSDFVISRFNLDVVHHVYFRRTWLVCLIWFINITTLCTKKNLLPFSFVS